ncbi:MAG: methyltransferase domain-containing protein [bacterium]|nr:methyltransferase domain-containing protein [bacterium]
MNIVSDVFGAYCTRVQATLAELPTAIWLDAGGGRVCEFGYLLTAEQAKHGVALDISLDDLLRNSLLTRGVKCDLNQPLPIGDSTVEFVFSSRMIEHLHNPAGFIRECFRILAPGGKLIITVPTGRAPFSVIKRLLPHEISRKLVTKYAPVDPGQLCWSKLYYRSCAPRALAKVCRHVGFEIENLSVSYSQAHHFRSLAIAYWPMKLYDTLAAATGLSGLAAYLLICAQKPKDLK